MTHNEYVKRYGLKIITITWSRDSHGLFDFETRQLNRDYFHTSESVNFIREQDQCKFVQPSVDIKATYKYKAQLLLSVMQKRNQYILKSPVYYILK